MRISRLYYPGSLAEKATLQIEGSQAHYLIKVLRADKGQKLSLFNGEGGEYSAQIIELHNKSVSVEVTRYCEDQKASPLAIHLAIGISKGERLDMVIQKATELGVSHITPLISERTMFKLQGERLSKKIEHWQKICISACEQCGLNRIPTINRPQKFEVFCQYDESDYSFIVHHRANKTFTKNQQISGSVSLVVGPEGGLSDSEIDLAEQCQFTALKMGPRILRTETAPITAISLIQFLGGDLQIG